MGGQNLELPSFRASLASIHAETAELAARRGRNADGRLFSFYIVESILELIEDLMKERVLHPRSVKGNYVSQCIDVSRYPLTRHNDGLKVISYNGLIVYTHLELINETILASPRYC